MECEKQGFKGSRLNVCTCVDCSCDGIYTVFMCLLHSPCTLLKVDDNQPFLVLSRIFNLIISSVNASFQLYPRLVFFFLMCLMSELVECLTTFIFRLRRASENLS